jgi:hypothetical protein
MPCLLQLGQAGHSLALFSMTGLPIASMLNCPASGDELINVRHKIFVAKGMKNIIKGCEVVKNAVFLEQAKRLMAFHMVFAFIPFKAKHFEMCCIAYNKIPPVNIRGA